MPDLWYSLKQSPIIVNTIAPVSGVYIFKYFVSLLLTKNKFRSYTLSFRMPNVEIKVAGDRQANERDKAPNRILRSNTCNARIYFR